MTNNLTDSALPKFVLASLFFAVVASGFSPTHAHDELERKSSWALPSDQEVAAKMSQWIEQLEVEPALKQSATTMLHDGIDHQRERLDLIMGILVHIEPDWQSIIVQANQSRSSTNPIDLTPIQQSTQSEFAKNHARLYVARWMVQTDFYDEAMEQFKKLTLDDVLDPAALLFYQSVAQHGLMKKDECVENIERMLENEEHLPARFASVGKLMLADIRPLKKDSLDEIARMMEDIRRRQSLYRSGKIVRTEEEEVLKKLDKMIEELEKKRQQQQASAASNPSSPMQDSQNAGGKGAGKVDPKKIAEGGEWGNIPPAKRAEALAEMTRDLPPHYRAVIEAYFRQLSQDQKAGENDK